MVYLLETHPLFLEKTNHMDVAILSAKWYLTAYWMLLKHSHICS